MKKIILVIVCTISLCGFSQETTNDNINQGPWKWHVDLRSNQILTRISKPIENYTYNLETRISIRIDRVELYEGIIFDLNKNIRATPSIGIEYIYDEQEFNSRLRLGIHGQYNMFSFVINYGSNWETYGVNTRFIYNVVGNRLQIGFESIDENIGPRLDMRINMGTNRVKLLRLYGSYVNNEFRYGIRFDFAQWFPKIDQKIKKIGDDLNPFKTTDN